MRYPQSAILSGPEVLAKAWVLLVDFFPMVSVPSMSQAVMNGGGGDADVVQAGDAIFSFSFFPFSFIASTSQNGYCFARC